MCGPDIKVQFYGNAPCGFYKYRYPKAVRGESGSVGAKVNLNKHFALLHTDMLLTILSTDLFLYCKIPIRSNCTKSTRI